MVPSHNTGTALLSCPSPMKVILLSALALALASCQPRSTESETRSVGDLLLVDMEGQPLDIDNFRGKKAVFVNFWATWCGPCVREMPSIARAQEQVGNEVEFLFVTDEPADRIQQFADKHQLTLRFIHAENLDILTLDALPTTYLLKKNGDVASIEIGFREWDTQENIDLIRQLAK